MDIASAVANLGFPIGIAIYLLTRFEKKMDGLEDSIAGRDGVIDKLEDIKSFLTKQRRNKKKGK